MVLHPGGKVPVNHGWVEFDCMNASFVELREKAIDVFACSFLADLHF